MEFLNKLCHNHYTKANILKPEHAVYCETERAVAKDSQQSHNQAMITSFASPVLADWCYGHW